MRSVSAAWASSGAPARIQSAAASRIARASASSPPSASRAAKRSARPESSGISISIRSCTARTVARVSRSREVSNGRWLVRVWISLAATARAVRSRAETAPGASLSTSRAQRSAPASQAPSRCCSTWPTGRGKTRLWTRLAQTMPRPISTTRAVATSNTVSGWLTTGKPISAAV